jgi:hypothetical protein
MTRTPQALDAVDSQWLDDVAAMVLAAVVREYPNHVAHLLRSDADARPPRELHPAFFGSFDWHSAVHGHWCLARILRLRPESPLAARLSATLAEHLAPERTGAEARYLEGEGRIGFERPYGLAWLLQLAAELAEWASAEALAHRQALSGLEAIAARRLLDYARKLPWPVRSGEHSQTAFALGLALDWARATGDETYAGELEREVRRHYAADAAAPVHWEPGGQDFLSPVLAEADLLRRVLTGTAFEGWLRAFLPDLASPAARRWLTPVVSPDSGDGKFAHLDGLNTSRAWMLEGIVSALPERAAERGRLRAAAAAHRAAGLARALAPEYAGSHWLGSFAIYLVSGRGMAASG